MTHKRFLDMVCPFQIFGKSSSSTTPSGKAGPTSTVASLTTAAGSSSTQSDAGKDDAAATRTVTAPAAAVTAAGCDQLVVDGNSSKQTTTATSSNVVPNGSVAPTSASTPTTTVAAASQASSASSSRSVAKTTPSATTTTVPTTSNSVTSSPSSGQCCRKQPPSAGSTSAAATLLHTLSLSGRRSRNSSTTPPCNCSGCCSGSNADTTVVEPPQSRSAFSNWISGGQKAADRNGTSPVPSGSHAKSKKPNWRVSLNCTIRRAAGGSSSSGGGAAGTSGKARSSTSEKFPVANGHNATVLSTTGGDLGHSNSIPSASGSTSHRGSSLISSSVSAKLLKSETDKDDTCVCTAYRKMSESPPPPQQQHHPLSGGTVSPGRPLSPPLPTVAVTDDPAFIPLNMLSLVASGGAATGGGATTSPQPQPQPATGMALPVPAESFSSLLHNHHHHLHHHHHHAMAAAALVAADHHHQSFFFPTSTASPGGGGGSVAAGPSVSGGSVVAAGGSSLFGNLPTHSSANGVILLSDPTGVFDLASDDFSLEDCDERARIQREMEIREGVDAPPNFHPRRLMSGGTISAGPAANHPIAFFYSRDLMQRGLLMANRFIQPLDAAAGGCPAGAAAAMAAAAAAAAAGRGCGAVAAAAFVGQRIHSQADFIHCLVPDLQKITSCSFYWGKMDRYEAERLLEGKPEGTFLLRDSAQEEFLFSVSFRKYNRSLHARIEQFNHKFSFDSRDPGVYTASTVTGLLEHYKDPSCVMFFEPMLTYPLNRNFSFSLQQLCRAAIVSNTTYDGIEELALPSSLQAYLKEYHYRQRVRFRPLDEHLYSNA